MSAGLLVTRPHAQAQDWVSRLTAQGVPALALPLIDIAAATDAQPVLAAWADLPQAALAMFVSANAVEHFMALRPAGAGWPPATLAGATGPGTAAALRRAGVPPVSICQPGPQGPFDSEGLWSQLAAMPWQGRLALVVRGEGGRDWLAERLGNAGAQVRFVAAYRRCLPALDASLAKLLDTALAQPQHMVWHFSSSEAVGNLGRLRPAADWSAAQALATHPRIAAAAREAGFGRVDEVGITVDDLAAWWRRHGPGAPDLRR